MVIQNLCILYGMRVTTMRACESLIWSAIRQQPAPRHALLNAHQVTTSHLMRPKPQQLLPLRATWAPQVCIGREVVTAARVLHEERQGGGHDHTGADSALACVVLHCGWCGTHRSLQSIAASHADSHLLPTTKLHRPRRPLPCLDEQPPAAYPSTPLTRPPSAPLAHLSGLPAQHNRASLPSLRVPNGRHLLRSPRNPQPPRGDPSPSQHADFPAQLHVLWHTSLPMIARSGTASCAAADAFPATASRLVGCSLTLKPPQAHEDTGTARAHMAPQVSSLRCCLPDPFGCTQQRTTDGPAVNIVLCCAVLCCCVTLLSTCVTRRQEERRAIPHARKLPAQGPARSAARSAHV